MSTGLVTYDPMAVRKEAQSLRRQMEAAEIRIAELEGQLRVEQAKSKAVERGARNLRTALQPLHNALGIIFGEIDAMGVSGESENGFTPPANPKKSAVWDSWKQKMGPSSAAAKIIDFLMLHGELTQTQMRIHLGTNRMQTVYDACSKLNKAQILNKTGDKFSLKEL